MKQITGVSGSAMNQRREQAGVTNDWKSTEAAVGPDKYATWLRTAGRFGVVLGLLVGLGLSDSAYAGSRTGKEIFAVCEACHGAHAEGNEAFGAPKLAGQHDWYLVTQLGNFRAGVRGVHEDDENGQIMRPTAMSLSDDDIMAVVEYIQTLDANYVSEE